MALVDEIPPGSAIALDTDCLIYYVEEHERYLPVVEPVVEAVIAGTLRAYVSVVTLLEVLVLPLRERRVELVEQYWETLTDPNVVSLNVVSVEQARLAANIRAQYRLETSDSIIAAMAIEANCTHIVTNDVGDFRRVPDLRVLAIDSFA